MGGIRMSIHPMLHTHHSGRIHGVTDLRQALSKARETQNRINFYEDLPDHSPFLHDSALRLLRLSAESLGGQTTQAARRD